MMRNVWNGLCQPFLVWFASILFLIVGFAESAQADWRKDLGVFRVGVISGSDPATALYRIEPFRLALSEALGMEVEILAMRDQSSIVDSIVSSRIEYAVSSATAYALAWTICECVEPLVIPRSSDGASSYNAVLISRVGGPASLSDVRNMPILGLVKDSIVGHALPVHLIREAGSEIITDDIGLVFKDNAESALAAFSSGEYEVLLGWESTATSSGGQVSGTIEQLKSRNSESDTDYQKIWTSSPIPHHPHTVRKNLDAEAKTILRDTLSQMFTSDPVAYDSIEPRYGGGFVAARQGSFSVLVDLINSGVVSELQETR